MLSDHLGSTSATASEAGVKLGELRYKAYGETRYPVGGLATTFRYTGQREEEGDLGLYCYRARWYDPELGRFVQADTIVPGPGDPLAYDRYAYVHNIYENAAPVKWESVESIALPLC
ncbi:MAG TPA: RHS repeat-associated core domain-containing protein [Anaerolineales bacterium]|nr:RHS repeat-associated core domain-containing protein [Anaerolineales bacterium]